MAQKILTSNPAEVTLANSDDTEIVFQEMKCERQYYIEVLSGDIKFNSRYEVNDQSASYEEGDKLVITTDLNIHCKANSTGGFRISY